MMRVIPRLFCVVTCNWPQVVDVKQPRTMIGWDIYSMLVEWQTSHHSHVPYLLVQCVISSSLTELAESTMNSSRQQY